LPASLLNLDHSKFINGNWISNLFELIGAPFESVIIERKSPKPMPSLFSLKFSAKIDAVGWYLKSI
jgi:hypothetical protein